MLDLRADRRQLGSIHRGLGNQLVPATFTQPLAAEVQQLITGQLPARAGARPVVLRVFALSIGEDLRPTSEHGEAELVADFLEPLPDSTFRMLLSVGEITRRGGLDVTNFHPTNIAIVLQQALRQLAALPAAPSATEVLSRADALAGRGGAAARRFAVQTAAAPKRGFYHSLQEFLDNAPTEPTQPFLVTHVPRTGKRWAGSDEIQVSYLYLDAAHPARPVPTGDLWGLSDGQELFIAYRNRFYQLLAAPDGRSYTFVGPPVFNPQVAAGRAAATIGGGLIGAALAGAAYGPDLMGPYELHLASGRVLPVQDASQTDADGFAKAPATAQVYVYRAADAARRIPLTLRAGGQTATDLPARYFLPLIWDDQRAELQICVQAGAGAEACQSFRPSFEQPTYLECTVPADGGAPVLRPVSAKEGALAVRRMQSVLTADASDK
ncbi:hypothetical protein GCM10022409_40360 [Hymenobacter glaciei]|uniref:Uncharacterized protein n=1 Tax=Hymenobacter glaciei TaxID=877209 RepID=A0ABP7UQ53_9BACT